jgi:lipopolysaccharide/colanic/teichoic acid biosynthesis glycosyltransferase
MKISKLRGESWLQSDKKRNMDKMIARTLLGASSPVLATAKATIRAVDGVDPTFDQLRKGRHGSQFTIHKLRTLPNTHEDTIGGGKNDIRASALGSILRKLHIDELPQLRNVLDGEMSMVGPRPIIAAAHEQVMDNLSPVEQVEWEWARSVALPGLADPYGIRMYAGEANRDPRTRAYSDIEYVATATQRGDFALLLAAARIAALGANNGSHQFVMPSPIEQPVLVTG